MTGFTHKVPKLKVVLRHKYLIAKCEGKNVLHLGALDCCCSSIICVLHKRLMEVSNHIIGLDFDSDGIDKARSEGIQNIHYGDLERLDEVAISVDFDVIVAKEIIEHLSNPGLFIDFLCKRPGWDGVLLFRG